MDTNTSRTFEIAYFISNCPLSDSNYDVIQKIKEKYNIEISYSSVQRFRKNLPRMQRLKLEKSRKELLPIILFIIDELKLSIKNLSDSDDKLKLKLVNELRECIKLYNELLNEEIKSLERKEPF